MKSVIIIGGGIIGLCSAYYLAKEGVTVTVIDKSDMADGCSYGNAGMIVPSHIIPMAQPGVIHQGIKWMFNAKSPFYIKPALSMDLLAWLVQFYKNSNQDHVNKSMVPLRNLSFFSKELYREFSQSANEFGYQEKGLLMLFNSEKMGEEEIKTGKVAEELGIEVDFLNQQEVKELEKNTFKGIFTSNRAKKLLQEDASITQLLELIVGKVELFEQYLFDQQFGHPGWSGMIATIENNPSSLLDSKHITLEELIKFELLLEIDTLDTKFNNIWSPLGFKVENTNFLLFEKVNYNELFDVLSLWQQAFDLHLYKV